MKIFVIDDENYGEILSTIENLGKLKKEYDEKKPKNEKIFKKTNKCKVEIGKELELISSKDFIEKITKISFH